MNDYDGVFRMTIMVGYEYKYVIVKRKTLA